ncbi:MAG TPA: FAD-dependent oxidoreductase, partial [Opitutaceae bacterium]|nr:FAD-dependent oxidoreductase [Opitutaceae bacterium]
MRHVRPFWEIHRHRLAPAVAKKIEILRAAGRLRFYAGRLEALLERPDGVEARFRERGTMRRNALRVAKVINCTGPRSDYSKYQHPLLINLLARGLIDHDPLALGLNALPDGTVLGYRSGPVGWLFTLGAPLKGVLWECTAVPEISRQAQLLAGRILAG